MTLGIELETSKDKISSLSYPCKVPLGLASVIGYKLESLSLSLRYLSVVLLIKSSYYLRYNPPVVTSCVTALAKAL